MKIKNKYALIFFVSFIFVVLVLTGAYFYKKNQGSVAGLFSRKNAVSPPQATVSPTRPPPAGGQTATPAPPEYTLQLTGLPQGLIAGGNATFNWSISGSKTTVKTTTVYFGTVSAPGKFTKEILPLQTKYGDYLTEFLNGDYAVPLTFIGNIGIDKPGTYFARAYAAVAGKNYWSDERTFTVKEAGYEVKIIDYKDRVKLNENSVFTWQINGLATTINYTAVVGSKESRPGNLSGTVALSDTPYRELTKEFVSGSFQVPLTYIGNEVLPEYGTWYFRALAVVNGKNIWSDEYSVTVE